MLFLEEGQPMVFGKEEKKGIVWNGSQPEVNSLGDADPIEKNVLIHKPQNAGTLYTAMLAEMNYPDFPTPVGVLRKTNKPTYETQINNQVDEAISKLEKKPSLQELVQGANTWTI